MVTYAHPHPDAYTAGDHAGEAERLLDDVWQMVRDGRLRWDSPAATNMVLAADVHARLATLKQPAVAA